MPRRTGKLLRTAGRTAVISGVATSTAGRVARRQQQRFASESGGQVASSHGQDDIVSSLQMLTALHNSGDLNDQEFKSAKAKLLS
jgi:hypothetical protein